ncbi:hypothetical protein EVAR_77361_1 [Eumeta japonica]|uniref:Uncharacterized protein n=1 Tax=Eumeta variegata TaxID=151549 RepID=A0A4C1UYG7_EUMVA|nr:hypothetical protein EVAR_77361_1 [Eumeta japonica]
MFFLSKEPRPAAEPGAAGYITNGPVTEVVATIVLKFRFSRFVLVSGPAAALADLTAISFANSRPTSYRIFAFYLIVGIGIHGVGGGGRCYSSLRPRRASAGRAAGVSFSPKIPGRASGVGRRLKRHSSQHLLI